MTEIRSRQHHDLGRVERQKTPQSKAHSRKRSAVNPSRVANKRNGLHRLGGLMKYTWIAILLFILWLGGLYAVCQSSDSQSPKLVEIQQLLRRRRGNVAKGRAEGQGVGVRMRHPTTDIAVGRRSDAVATTGQKYYKTGIGGVELIDMREWSKTLPFANLDGGGSYPIQTLAYVACG